MICGGHVGPGWQQARRSRKPEFHRAGKTVRPKQNEENNRYGILYEQMDCEEVATQEGQEGNEAQDGVGNGRIGLENEQTKEARGTKAEGI